MEGIDQPRLLKQTQRPALVTASDQAIQVLRDIRNPNLVPLGAGVPALDHLPLPALMRMLGRVARLHPKSCAQYDIPPGCAPYREQVARRAMEAGCSLAPDEVVTTCGTMEALTLALRVLTKPGQTVILESPTYFNMFLTLQSLGLRALELPTHPVTGIDLQSLQTAIERHRVAACLLCPNMHNPLGCSMPDENKRKLVKMLAEREIPLIEDDIYGELVFSNTRCKPAKAFDRDGWVLWCGSFSKTLCPGFRTGWIAPGRFQSQIEQAKMLLNVASPAAPFLATAALLENGGYDRHLRNLRAIFHSNLTRLSQGVAEHFPVGTRMSRPQGGFTLWIEWTGSADAMEVYRRALDAGISIAPGPIFTATRQYQNCMRLNAGLKWSSSVEAAVAKLGRIVKELSNTTRVA